jgi:putative transposase
MARIARLVVPDLPHHITQRGNRRQLTFFTEDDYEAYKALMARSCAVSGVKVLAYCLMPNHVHLTAGAAFATPESLAGRYVDPRELLDRRTG